MLTDQYCRKTGVSRQFRRGVVFWGAWAVPLVVAVPLAAAHDIEVPQARLQKDIDRVSETLRFYRSRPALPNQVETTDDQRRLLGAAEIEFALGNSDRALEILMGRLADPRFQDLPVYLGTLLLTSQILETRGEHAGAMMYAETALRAGGTPEQMAEAGARWFRVARRSQRLERRSEMYALWQQQGGETAAGSERAAMVQYEVAFALRAEGDFAEALRLLQRVPSDSAFGSRAAYVAAVAFVEYGDLVNAERWFSAVMGWPLPALPEAHPQLKIERQVRQLAALSAGRLRFERDDLVGAVAAYKRVPPSSPFGTEACWERAYLELERSKQRGALKQFQCVVDLGARGQRGFQARLFKASLLAHLERYTESIESYETLHGVIDGQHRQFAAAVRRIRRPAEFLFAGMERDASRTPDPVPASPGPATLLADAWTTDVDRAYRVDRGAASSVESLDDVLRQLDEIDDAVRSARAFVGIKVRRQHLELLLREVRHLEGHAGRASRDTRDAHRPVVDHDHAKDVDALESNIRTLRSLGRGIEDDLEALLGQRDRRRAEALVALDRLRQDVLAIRSDLLALEDDAEAPVAQAAQDAILAVQAALRDLSMKAEFGVLDTYWLKKQHQTRAVEALLRQQKETDRLLDEALDTTP